MKIDYVYKTVARSCCHWERSLQCVFTIYVVVFFCFVWNLKFLSPTYQIGQIAVSGCIFFIIVFAGIFYLADGNHRITRWQQSQSGRNIWPCCYNNTILHRRRGKVLIRMYLQTFSNECLYSSTHLHTCLMFPKLIIYPVSWLQSSTLLVTTQWLDS